MIINYLTLFSLSLVFLLYLIRWNRKEGYEVHQWSGDAKNVRLFLHRINDPRIFKKDFIFNKNLNINFYMPFPLAIISWVQGRIGSLRKTIFILQITMAIAFVLSWGCFAYLATQSVSASFVALFLATPLSSTLAGDGISGPLPGNWPPRFWSNAFAPFLLILLYLSFKNPMLLLPAALVSGFIFNLHPVTGIGTFIFVFLASSIQFCTGHISLAFSLLTLLVNLLLTIPFVLSYLKNSASCTHLSPEERKAYNAAGRERILLWPANYSVFERFFGKRGQLVTGFAYMVISSLLFWYRQILGPDSYSMYQSLINLVLISILLNRHEPFGYIVLIFGLLGLLGITQASLVPVTIILILMAIVYRYRRYSFQPFFIMLLPALGIVSCVLNGSLCPPRMNGSIQQVFLWSIPLIFSAYLFGCTLFHWYLPFKANKTVSFVDWGRILKSAIYPVIFLAFFALSDLASLTFSLPFPGNISAALCLLIPVFCAWRYKIGYLTANEPEEDVAIFAWIKNNLPKNACLHVLSNLPPYHDPERQETSSFAFRLRANTLRSITGAWKDGGISFYVSPDMFFLWLQRMKEVAACIQGKRPGSFFECARQYGADYLIISNNLLMDHAPARKPIMVFPNYTIFQI